MIQSWFKKERTPEQLAVTEAVETLERAREKRKNILQHVLQKIDSIPIDRALEDLGRDLGWRNRN